MSSFWEGVGASRKWMIASHFKGSLIGNGGNTSQLLFQKPIENIKQIF
jgi:hypothetical protein